MVIDNVVVTVERSISVSLDFTENPSSLDLIYDRLNLTGHLRILTGDGCFALGLVFIGSVIQRALMGLSGSSGWGQRSVPWCLGNTGVCLLCSVEMIVIRVKVRHVTIRSLFFMRKQREFWCVLFFQIIEECCLFGKCGYYYVLSFFIFPFHVLLLLSDIIPHDLIKMSCMPNNNFACEHFKTATGAAWHFVNRCWSYFLLVYLRIIMHYIEWLGFQMMQTK